MLYDPKWEKQTETKADPQSLEAFTAWLEQQPLTQSYDYVDPDGCLIAQWLKSLGAEKYNLDSFEVADLFGGRGDHVAFSEPWTFGAALERARSFVK